MKDINKKQNELKKELQKIVKKEKKLKENFLEVENQRNEILKIFLEKLKKNISIFYKFVNGDNSS